jgi:hypothetical protein
MAKEKIPNKPAGRKAQEALRPLPMRISERSYQRLEALRAADDLTIQEHVRRGIDYYLEHAEIAIALSATQGLADAISALAASPIPKTSKNALVPNLMAKHAPKFTRNPQPEVIRK